MSTEPQPDRPAQKFGLSDESPMMTVISACLFLYVGFGVAFSADTGNAAYDISVSAFTWGARIVGIGLLIVAALSFAGGGMVVLLLDVVVSFIAAAGCLVIGVIWVVYSDTQGFLVILFGLLNGGAARGAWVRWRAHTASRSAE